MFNLRLTRMPYVAAVVAAAALAGGCASGPDVRGDYDPAKRDGQVLDAIRVIVREEIAAAREVSA